MAGLGRIAPLSVGRNHVVFQGWPRGQIILLFAAISLGSTEERDYFLFTRKKMKTITINAVSVGIAAAVLLAAVGLTWAAARSQAGGEVASLQKQVSACESRVSAQAADHSQAMQSVNTTLAERERQVVQFEQLKNDNEKMREELEQKDQTVASGPDKGQGGKNAGHKAEETPVQTFEVGLGEEQELIPGVLKLKVNQFDGNEADVTYGGHSRHVKVGGKVGIGYLGRRCLLALKKVKGSGDDKKGEFSFTVGEPNRWRGRALATTRDQ